MVLIVQLKTKNATWYWVLSWKEESPGETVTVVVWSLPQVAPVIKARMMEYGTTMVSYQPLGDKVNFFRVVISNPAATHQDIDFLIEEIERLGQDL